MNNEVRKPQDWWIYEQYNQAADLGIIRMATKERFSKENREQFSETHCKEILPGDDSIRVSQVLTADLQMILSHVNPLNMSLADETTYWQLKNRIERENKGE